MFLKLRDWIDESKLEWKWLSKNPNAMHLLEANQDKIDWMMLSSNPAIFEYDYELIQNTNMKKNEEIYQYVYHPRFIQKYIDRYGVDALDEYME
jgi:hypothetical protein